MKTEKVVESQMFDGNKLEVAKLRGHLSCYSNQMTSWRV